MENLVNKFQSFLASEPGFTVDMEVADNSKLPKLIGADYRSADLEVFAESNDGSGWAIWKSENASPVILISAESIPFDVAAKDFETFLALLRYGTGLIYQCLTFLDFAKRMGQSEKQALKRFDKKYLEKELQRFHADYPDYQKLYSFIEAQGIALIDDPVQSFLATSKLGSAFAKWKDNL
ncbi:hypothetical protein ACS5PU_03715 [Pedobacter sp. GSP4]|uniref:hypothetical protein n=1 Tax=Pedobacter sp. GSP4 TaxID=3453716 RepID=UPI003EEDC547